MYNRRVVLEILNGTFDVEHLVATKLWWVNMIPAFNFINVYRAAFGTKVLFLFTSFSVLTVCVCILFGKRKLAKKVECKILVELNPWSLRTKAAYLRR
jgi:hypothetical protein